METSAKILLIDDENNILKSLQRMLRSEPYAIKSVNTPLEAIELVKNEFFDVIISDYRMPEMNGKEMFYKINKIQPEGVKIILSGYSDINIITEALNKEYIDKYILKPWNDENLKLEIQKSINHSKLKTINKQLHIKILEQNQKLKDINEDLEKLVLEKTKKFTIQNHALKTSHNTISAIAVPIVAVDTDFMVIMTNKLAEQHFPYFIPGDIVSDSLLKQDISQCFNSKEQKTIFAPEFNVIYSEITIAPVFQKNQLTGAVITFIPNKTKG